ERAEAGEIDALQAASNDIAARIRAAQAQHGAGGATSTPSAAGLIWPVNGPVTSPFGWRWGRMHQGIDIGAPMGAAIEAAAAGTVVSRRLTSWPITSRRAVKTTSGIKAKGMPNESTTCERTSVRDGSIPRAITTKAGIIVTRRRTVTGIWRWMNPCITTCPDSVPTAELESPEATSARAKSALDALPRIGSSVLWAVSSDATCRRPV